MIQWIVTAFDDDPSAYGPFDDEDLAERFAGIVDEATDSIPNVLPLRSPVQALLRWHDGADEQPAEDRVELPSLEVYGVAPAGSIDEGYGA